MIQSIPAVVRTLAGLGTSPSFRECRHCGERVDRATAACPACGHTGIAEYDLN